MILALLFSIQAFSQVCAIPSGVVQTDSASQAMKQNRVITLKPTADCKSVMIYKVQPLAGIAIPEPTELECNDKKYKDAMTKPVLLQCMIVPVFTDASIVPMVPPYAYLDPEGRMVVKHLVNDKPVSEFYYVENKILHGATLTGQKSDIDLKNLADAQKEISGQTGKKKSRGIGSVFK